MERVVERLSRLPGVGRRSAQRIGFYLLKSPPQEAQELSEAIHAQKASTRQCSQCFDIAETDPCPICADSRRDHQQILVVEQPSDVAMVEAMGAYRGVYHVLMGRLAPLEGVGPGELTIEPLLQRVARERIGEVIIGTNPTFDGDGTALYLARRLEASGAKVSRLARGLAIGSSLETSSKAALAEALEGRRPMGG